MHKVPLLTTLGILIASCQQPTPTPPVGKADSLNQANTEAKAAMAPAAVDSLVRAIDALKLQIEKSLDKPVELSTKGLRAEVRQKWEKVHFYTIAGQVVRVKTYPYKEHSQRTEEFYLQNGLLVLAVIEDDGSGARDAEKADKAYYYHNNALIREIKSAEEGEYSVRDSDAEELLSELKEYLSLYQARP